MKAIIAVNNLGYIGLENGIPWRSSEDFKHFKKLTTEVFINRLLVGHNTAKTLPTLKNRDIIVDIRGSICLPNNFEWCIGGKKTYEKYCHLFTELHISYINDNTIGDTMFPNLEKLNPNCKIFKYYFEPNIK